MTAAEAAVWRVLRLEALTRYPDAFLTNLAEAQELPNETIAQRLAGGLTFGVFSGTDCMGIGTLQPHARVQCRHRADIVAFFIRPAVHGKGAGDALLAGLLDHAETLGCWQTELHVADSNTHAIALYERHGFRQAGCIPNTVILEGRKLNDLIMVCTRAPRGQGPVRAM